MVAFEGKEFKFPKTMNCESCILQLTWETEKGALHQCADLIIEEKVQVEDCGGNCLNGGVCQNGECKCRSNYSGQFCQYKESAGGSGLLWYFLVFAVLILIIAGLGFASYTFWKKMQAD